MELRRFQANEKQKNKSGTIRPRGNGRRQATQFTQASSRYSDDPFWLFWLFWLFKPRQDIAMTPFGSFGFPFGFLFKVLPAQTSQACHHFIQVGCSLFSSSFLNNAR
jgi:hypothetical protein